MNTEQLKTGRTKEEILERSIGNKYAKCIQKPFTDEYFYPTNAIYKAMQDFASQESKRAVEKDRESRWISVKERLPEVDEETGRSESVLCIGWKGTHPDWIEYECMYFKRLDNPELMDRNGKPISFGWSKRWWDTNPDLFSIHFWQPLPEAPKHY